MGYSPYKHNDQVHNPGDMIRIVSNTYTIRKRQNEPGFYLEEYKAGSKVQ